MAVRSMTTANENHWVKSVWPSGSISHFCRRLKLPCHAPRAKTRNARDWKMANHRRKNWSEFLERRWVGFDETVSASYHNERKHLLVNFLPTDVVEATDGSEAKQKSYPITKEPSRFNHRRRAILTNLLRLYPTVAEDNPNQIFTFRKSL